MRGLLFFLLIYSYFIVSLCSVPAVDPVAEVPLRTRCVDGGSGIAAAPGWGHQRGTDKFCPPPDSPDKPPWLCRGIHRDVIRVSLEADSLPDRVTQAKGCDKGTQARGGVSRVVAARAGDLGPRGGISGGFLLHPGTLCSPWPRSPPRPLCKDPSESRPELRCPKRCWKGPSRGRAKPRVSG